jgi:hypothetical protein
MPALAAEPAILSEEQIYHFLEEGWVLVPGLVPKDIARAADAAAWRCNGIDPQDPSTWGRVATNEFFTDPDLMAAYTPELLRAAAQLGENPALYPICNPPENAFVIKLMPERAEWRVIGQHVDGGGTEKAPNHTFTRQWHAFSMIYLHDVEPHGGGTVLWPRSARRLEAIARSHPHRYRWGYRLNEHLPDLLGEPIELSPKAGDVLFMHPRLAHAKPMNTGSRPRFAMHAKWPG